MVNHIVQIVSSFLGVRTFQIFTLADFSSVGTTEKIFESKTGLYDVYVDNQVVRTHSPILKELLKCSSADKDKFHKLNNLR